MQQKHTALIDVIQKNDISKYQFQEIKIKNIISLVAENNFSGAGEQLKYVQNPLDRKLLTIYVIQEDQCYKEGQKITDLESFADHIGWSLCPGAKKILEEIGINKKDFFDFIYILKTNSEAYLQTDNKIYHQFIISKYATEIIYNNSLQTAFLAEISEEQGKTAANEVKDFFDHVLRSTNGEAPVLGNDLGEQINRYSLKAQQYIEQDKFYLAYALLGFLLNEYSKTLSAEQFAEFKFLLGLIYTKIDKSFKITLEQLVS